MKRVWRFYLGPSFCRVGSNHWTKQNPHTLKPSHLKFWNKLEGDEMSRSTLIPSLNPAHSFRLQFPLSNPSFSSPPSFLRVRRCGNRRRGVTMSAGKDHYKTLNVARNATLKEIKSAYRALARKVTPSASTLLLCFILFLIVRELWYGCKTVSSGHEQEPWGWR